MRNAVYPSFSSQICNFGNNEIQMPNNDVSVNLCESNFFRDSQMSNDQHLGSFAPLSTIEIPQALNYLHLPGLLTSSTISTTTAAPMYENTSQPRFLQRKIPITNTEAVVIKKDRKRTIKSEDGWIDNKTVLEESKKMKAICLEDRHVRPCQTMEEQPSKTEEQKVPVRRSQKIGDRITALQKLVSPFGKTDTASVLQEASVHIKLLQEQIQMLSVPYFGVRSHYPQGAKERKVDLRSRGLCLVPVSFTQNLTQDQVDNSISRNTIISRKK